MASQLIEAVNKFTLKLHSKLMEDDENIFFSPLSLAMALSMVLRGAKNATAIEMKQALQFENMSLSEQDIHSHFQQLLNLYMENEEFYILAVANAVICQKDFPFLQEYKSDLEKYYAALVMEADFCHDSVNAISKVNNWVKENTKGKIEKIFESLDPNTVMVLLNSIYFKGDWEYQFDTKETYDGMFYNKGVSEQAKTVPLMHMKRKFFFVEKEMYKVLELPYKSNHISMLIILPHDMNGLENIEKSLSGNFLTKIREELTEIKVEVTIPKIHLEYSKQLIPILKSLGIKELFKSEADLTGLSECKNLYVSEVIHKAVLDVNEEGSEAAAVTAIAISYRCMTFDPEFRADHPFLFLIFDKRSNLILFMGHVHEL